MNNMSNLKKWAIVFIIGLFLYSLVGETVHFFNHLFPGMTLGVIFLIILALQKKKTEKYEFTIPFLTYFFAIIPEFFAFGRSFIEEGALHHASWENIFLLHNTLDHLLEQTELILPATAILLYLVVFIYGRVKKYK